MSRARFTEKAESPPLPLQTGDTLKAGETLRTGTGATASLRFFDGSRLLVAQNTRLTLARLHQYGRTGMADTTIRLHEGDVDSRVPPRPGTAVRYRIESPVLNLGVRGTEFRAGIKASGLARSEVLSGRVHARGTKGPDSRMLDAGFGTTVGADHSLSPPVALPPAPTLDGLPAHRTHLPLRFAWPAREGVSRWRAQILPAEGDEKLLLDGRFDAPEAKWPTLPDGHYRLRVRAIADNGLEGIDAEHRFVLAARPEAPLPLLPQEGQWLRDDQIRLRWAQPLAVTGYHLQVTQAGDDDFDAPLLDLPALTGHEHGLTLPPGDYVWRLASIDETGRRGPFGPPHRFSRRAPPDSPTPGAPTVDDGLVQLRWPAGSPGQTFQIQLAQDSAFEQIVLDERVDTPGYALSREHDGRFFLRLRTVDHDGFAGPYSRPQQIDIPGKRPLWPLLLLPLVLIL